MFLDNGFKLKDIDRYSFKDFLRTAETNIIIHVLDHCDDLEYNWDGTWKVINYVTKWCCSEIVKYIIDKDIDLENPCSNSWRPIHYVALLHDGETTRKLVSKGVDIMISLLSDNETALDIIVSNQDKETIIYTLDFVFDLTEEMLTRLLINLNDNSKINNDDKELIKYQLVSKIV